jgi:hypothetical protein
MDTSEKRKYRSTEKNIEKKKENMMTKLEFTWETTKQKAKDWQLL